MEILMTPFGIPLLGTSNDWLRNGSFYSFLSDGPTPYLNPALQEVAVNAMVNGNIKTMVSPCGMNCSYTL
jgi:hypothetical protein